MNTPSPEEQGAVSLKDILLGLYRHKWLILICGILGLAGAATIRYLNPPQFESTAKLLIRYVVERSQVDPVNAAHETGRASGDPLLITEMEIITSYDLAEEVARTVGPERLAPEWGDQATPENTAHLVSTGIEVEAVSNVLHVSYRSDDPAVSEAVLDQIVEEYFKRHLEIRREVKSFEYVSSEAERAKERLAQTDEQLNKLKLESGIMSLEAAVDSHEALRAQLDDEIQETELELEVQQARVNAIEAAIAEKGGASEEGIDDALALERRRADVFAADEYAALERRLATLEGNKTELRTKYRPGHQLVRSVDAQIGEVRTQMAELVERFPTLVLDEDGTAAGDLVTARGLLADLQERMKVLKRQLAQLDQEFKQDYQVGVRVDQLEEQRADDAEKFDLLQSSLDQARVDEALDPSRIPNISILQKPSPPIPTLDELTPKLMYGLAAGGFFIGAALALALDLVFDRRIKRPTEIETRLQLPLMLSIPYFRKWGRSDRIPLHTEKPVARIGDGDSPMLPGEAEETPRRAASDHFILPYAEAIRDRVILNFQFNNLTHKPKLVAVTGLGEGAGTSTIAAGLARAFAETPGCKVLLVDMNSEMESAPSGRTYGVPLPHSLNGAIEMAQGDEFRRDERNLFLASVKARRTPNEGLSFAPKHLYDLLPHLRTCEFDYIIFDMPAVETTSPTLAMAGMMDKVLLVLDSESSSRESLKWGYSELVKGRADVSCIFNKARNAPKWIDDNN